MTATNCEIITATNREIQWLTFFLQDLQVPFKSASLQSLLYCDNQFALYIVVNLIFHECTKYIELDCHIKRTQRRLMKLLPISFSWQFTNIYNKVLSPNNFIILFQARSP